MNAVDTAFNLLKDAGVTNVSFNIDDVPDDEVREIAKDLNISLFEPTVMNPYYWCVIRKEDSKVMINGIRKRVELTTNFI